MDQPIDLLQTEKPKRDGVTIAVSASVVVHIALMILFVRAYKPIREMRDRTPITRYVELIRQNPKEFTEAPGPKVATAPLTAPYSDANRRASMPKPTGANLTTRPGTGGAIYTPPAGSQDSREASSGDQAAAQRTQQSQQQANAQSAAVSPSRIQALRTEASMASSANLNWNSALRDLGKAAPSPGSGGPAIDLSGATGGETGSAEAGPLSFETQWYDWGDYAQSMVSKIRLHWYQNMPQLIRTGLKGVVTVRFTIHRDGSITDITTITSSTIPPYDFAARKAIGLASPLNPLPKDFPNAFERVTAMFYYNSDAPK